MRKAYDANPDLSMREQLEPLGYDGVISTEAGEGLLDDTAWYAFLPEQIKSAIGRILLIRK